MKILETSTFTTQRQNEINDLTMKAY